MAATAFCDRNHVNTGHVDPELEEALRSHRHVERSRSKRSEAPAQSKHPYLQRVAGARDSSTLASTRDRNDSSRTTDYENVTASERSRRG
jgi:hypothetical protein